MSRLLIRFMQISIRVSRPGRGARPGGRGCQQQILGEFKNAMASWASAVQAHKEAPPDLGFAARLAALAQGASEAARVCRAADATGFEWQPARKADSEPPYRAAQRRVLDLSSQ